MAHTSVKIGTVTWNIGKKKEKVERLITYINQKENQFWDNDIAVFAFQEVSGFIEAFSRLVLGKVNQKIADYHGKKPFNALHYNSACNSIGVATGFRIVLVVLTKDTVPQQEKGQISVCPSNLFDGEKATKGFTSVEINLPQVGNTTVRFCSVHFPFDSTDYAKGIETMLTNLENSTASTEHEILLGDVNSRSCWLPGRPNIECARDVDVADAQKLQDILNDESLESKQTTNPSLVAMRKNDFFNTLLTSRSWKEQGIPFMPTYKINKDNGKYELKRDDNGRLSGFPDRIFQKSQSDASTKLESIESSYKKLRVTGNDHFPVMCEFKLYVPNQKDGSTESLTDAHPNQNSAIDIPTVNPVVDTTISSNVKPSSQTVVTQNNTGNHQHTSVTSKPSGLRFVVVPKTIQTPPSDEKTDTAIQTKDPPHN